MNSCKTLIRASISSFPLVPLPMPNSSIICCTSARSFSSLSFFPPTQLVWRSEEKSTAKTNLVGGVHNLEGNQNGEEILSLARFAIQEHNKQQNNVLEFKKIVKARQQVVAGMMYYLTLEAKEGGQTKNFEAKVWVKSWLNFKELQEFKESSS